jgi:flagellar hook-length control protein FliK
MATIPNTRSAPTPVAAGQPPAAAPGATGFAAQFAGIPEELLRIAASASTGGGGDAPDAKPANADGDVAKPAAAAPSDAAQLAALAPLLQPLPATLPAAVLAPAPPPAPQIAPRVDAAVAQAAVTIPASASALAPTGKVKLAKTDVQQDAPNAQSEGDTATPAPDVPAKDLIAAAKRALEATTRSPTPATATEATSKGAPPAPKPAAASQAIGEATTALPATTIVVPAADITASSLLVMSAPAPAPSPAAALQPRAADAPVPDHMLDLVRDSAWLDRLAHDIAQAAGNEGTIRFRLHPQTLGHLSVELSQGDHGTSVRLTADTEQARAILADAQPRLAAEARAQGVRIAETHVDLSGSDRQASGDPRRQDEARQTPLIRTARDAAAGDDASERPGRAGSDRYA